MGDRKYSAFELSRFPSRSPHECSTLEENVGATPQPPGASRDRPYYKEQSPLLEGGAPHRARRFRRASPPCGLDADERLQRQMDNVFSIRKGLDRPSSLHMCKHTQGQAGEMPLHGGCSALLCSRERTLTTNLRFKKVEFRSCRASKLGGGASLKWSYSRVRETGPQRSRVAGLRSHNLQLVVLEAALLIHATDTWPQLVSLASRSLRYSGSLFPG